MTPRAYRWDVEQQLAELTRDRTEHLRALADHEPTDYLRGTDRRVEDVPWELRGVFEE